MELVQHIVLGIVVGLAAQKPDEGKPAAQPAAHEAQPAAQTAQPAAHAEQPAAKVEEQAVGPVGPGVTYVVSPRGAHLASIASKGSRKVVTVDGVVGPKFDEILVGNGSPYPLMPGLFLGSNRPVVFSPDGRHFAYAGAQGAEAVIVLDGKEVQRLPYVQNFLQLAPLQFSPGSRHFYYICGENRNDVRPRFVLDGAVSAFLPSCAPPNCANGIVFSADDLHWAFAGTGAEKPLAPVVVVDGRGAGFAGDDLQFTPDGKHVLCLQREPSEQRLLVDGQVALRAQRIQRVRVPPAGNRIVSVLERSNRDGTNSAFLVVDGKRIEDSVCESIQDVVCSPDGKRYAAVCTVGSRQQQWIVLDGKKGQPYAGISFTEKMGFTADSSQFVYLASNGGQTFVVANEQESDGCQQVIVPPVFAPAGARWSCIVATAGSTGSAVLVDGKAFPPRPSARLPGFSPDGSRAAWIQGGGATFGEGTLVVDGVEHPDLSAARFRFSPDGKHLAFLGGRIAEKTQGLFVDEQCVYAATDLTRVDREAFTPDGRHFVWQATEPSPSGATPPNVVYVDGEAVGRFEALPGTDFASLQEAWQMGDDGVLTVLRLRGDAVRRVTVTPSADLDLATMIAKAKSSAAVEAAAPRAPGK